MKAITLLALLYSVTCVLIPAAQATPQSCPRQMMEDDWDWEQRCRREAEAEQYGKQLDRQQKAEQERATLKREPALAPASNPLLGRWLLPAAVGSEQDGNILSQLTGLIDSMSTCGPLVGSAAIEFLPDRMIHVAGDGEQAAEAVSYRARGNGVFVVTPPGRPLLFFRFLAKDRVQLGTLESCELTRAR